jgi:hypothetical protein
MVGRTGSVGQGVVGWQVSIRADPDTLLRRRWGEGSGTRTVLQAQVGEWLIAAGIALACVYGAIHALGVAVSRETLVVGLPALVACAVAVWSAIRWFLPAGQMVSVPYETLRPGDWVVCGTVSYGVLSVSPITSVFTHGGWEARPVQVGLLSGDALSGARTDQVNVAVLGDVFWGRRRPPAKPRQVPERFAESTEAVLLALACVITASQPDLPAMSAPDLVAELSGHMDAATAWQALELAQGLGLLRVGPAMNRQRRMVAVTDAGHVWHAQACRDLGIEVFEDAVTSRPEVVHMHGDRSIYINTGGGSVGNTASGDRNQQAVNGDLGASDLDTVSRAVAIVRERMAELDLSEADRHRLESALDNLDDSVADQELKTGTVRRALAAVLKLSGDLLIELGGHALWETLRRLAS